MTLLLCYGIPDKIDTGLTGGVSNTYVTEIQTIFKSPTGVMVVVDNFFYVNGCR
jgi:hypothetical protein